MVSRRPDLVDLSVGVHVRLHEVDPAARLIQGGFLVAKYELASGERWVHIHHPVELDRFQCLRGEEQKDVGAFQKGIEGFPNESLTLAKRRVGPNESRSLKK